MSDTIEAIESIERRVTNKLADLEQRGETVEAECHCGSTSEVTALPEETVDVTICRSCATDRAREANLI